MLCEVAGMVALTVFPVDSELILVSLIMNPIKLHVHGFRTTLFNGAVGNAASGGVASLHRCNRLQMAHDV
jgi:hypothetical protein